MYDKGELSKIRESQNRWEATTLKRELETKAEVKPEFKTPSGIPIKRLYTPLDLEERGWNYNDKLGYPGEYPLIRGTTATGYRGNPIEPWVYVGFGTGEDASKRFKFLLEHGTLRIAIALDLPTQLGYDSDHPLSRWEVGRVGLAVDSVADFEAALEGVPLQEIEILTTGAAMGPIMYAMLAVACEHQGIPVEKAHLLCIFGDVLKEYVGRGNYIFPAKHALKFEVDLIEYLCRNNLSDRVNPLWISGYHMRNAGANAIQEMAFTMANSVAYADDLVSRGVDINKFYNVEGNLVAGTDFFEGICEQRAFRRWWAKVMKERYNATNVKTLSFHVRTGNQTDIFTDQQPLNNLVRGTISLVAQALGGAQTINCSGMEEALSLRTEESHFLQIRQQQVIIYETGLLNTVDPLAGSYFIEALTDDLEERATELFNKIEKMGGAVAAIENGFMRQLLLETATQAFKELESGERIIVGLNKFRSDEPPNIPVFKFDETVEERQVNKLKKLRKERDNPKVKIALKELREAAIEGVNLTPYCIAAVKAYATMGEMCDVLREVWGVSKPGGLK